MSFESIVGHTKALTILRRQIGQKQIPGGYLFIGPRGVGKMATASAFARALMCPHGGDDTCTICRRITEHNFPDVECIDYVWQETIEGKKTARTRQTLGIKAIQAVQARAGLKPMEARWKIFIIDQADTMTPEAANCFLKILEEPPEQTVFILVAEHEHRILPTIRSRCQTIRFGFLDRKNFQAVVKLPAGQQRVMYDAVDGAPGEAIAQGKSIMDDLEQITPFWDQIQHGNLRQVLAGADHEYGTADEITAMLTALMRKAKVEYRRTPGVHENALRIILGGLNRLRRNVNPRLVRDATLIKLVTRSRTCQLS